MIGFVGFFYLVIIPLAEYLYDACGYKQSKIDVYESYVNLMLLRQYGKPKGTIN